MSWININNLMMNKVFTGIPVYMSHPVQCRIIYFFEVLDFLHNQQ